MYVQVRHSHQAKVKILRMDWYTRKSLLYIVKVDKHKCCMQLPSYEQP